MALAERGIAKNTLISYKRDLLDFRVFLQKLKIDELGITSSEVLGSHIGKQQHPHNVIMTPHLKFSNANAYSTLYEESHQFKRSNSQNEFDYINSSGRVVFGEQHCDNLNNFNFGSHHQ